MVTSAFDSGRLYDDDRPDRRTRLTAASTYSPVGPPPRRPDHGPVVPPSQQRHGAERWISRFQTIRHVSVFHPGSSRRQPAPEQSVSKARARRARCARPSTA